jgi:hypothetical protein
MRAIASFFDPTFTCTTSAIRRRKANPWKGDTGVRVRGEIDRIEAGHTTCPNRATGDHGISDPRRATMTRMRLAELQQRRVLECRLTPDRALGSLDEAEAFLLDRGLLTRTADSALPSLFAACHEEPYAPGKPGFGQWPRTKYPWFGELGARGHAILAIHRGKSLLVSPETARLLDPLCRAELASRKDDPLLRHLAEAGPSELDDLQLELGLAPRELKRLRAPLERCGAVVARSVVYEDPHRHTSELARWDQRFPEPAEDGGLAALVVAGVRAAVLAPERELPRWFPWWEDGLVERLVGEGQLVRPEDDWVAAQERGRH